MRFALFWSFSVAIAGLSSLAFAQDKLPGQAPGKPDLPATGKPGGKPGKVPGPGKPAPAADTDKDEDEDFAPPSIKKKATSEPETEAEATRTEPAAPPLRDPRVDEQRPTPYLQAPRGLRRDRHVEFGPDVGVWSRPARGSGIKYSPGLAYGAHARIELFSFLGLRAYASQASHSVEVGPGELGVKAVDQPALDVLQIGARLEPTYLLLPTLRLWAGLGVAWGRAVAKEPDTSGELQDPAERAGVFVEWSGALGATWDVIPTWLALTGAVSGGMLSNQSGSMFEERQTIDSFGQIRQIGGLPEFKSSFSALIGVGMIL